MPPLIELNIKLNDVLEIPAIYDPGSNVSLINSKLVQLKSKDNNNIGKTNLRTINGGYKTDGLIKIKIKILNIEDHMNVFIINNENFKYNFLLGLDCIKNFKLIQNEKLEIEQKSSESTEPIIKVLRIQHKMYTTPRASPTLTTSDTHAREPRQSALSTCLPLRPSNYQSEGLRCPAARSVSSVQRATAEREQQPSARLQRHDVQIQ